MTMEASRTFLENRTLEGESPVGDSGIWIMGILSRTEHVKLGLNLGGPPSKAKYSLMTDSELVP